MINAAEMKSIKVEISLNDLVELQETAKMYFFGIEERENLVKRNLELKEEIEKLHAKLEGLTQ
jgi:hypothetical protein